MIMNVNSTNYTEAHEEYVQEYKKLVDLFEESHFEYTVPYEITMILNKGVSVDRIDYIEYFGSIDDYIDDWLESKTSDIEGYRIIKSLINENKLEEELLKDFEVINLKTGNYLIYKPKKE